MTLNLHWGSANTKADGDGATREPCSGGGAAARACVAHGGVADADKGAAATLSLAMRFNAERRLGRVVGRAAQQNRAQARRP